MALRTQDGGETWDDIAPSLRNPQNFHLNSVAQVTGGALVIVGEAGQVHVSVDNGESWERRESPYDGSLFGVMGTGKINEILTFGLRGNTLLSDRKSTRLNSSHVRISYAVFCLKKKKRLL